MHGWIGGVIELLKQITLGISSTNSLANGPIHALGTVGEPRR